MGVATGDYDGDGRLDILKTHFADDVPALYRNLGKLSFRGRRDASWASRWRTDSSNGAPACPIWISTAVPTSSTSPAACIRKSKHGCRSIPHRGPRVIFRNVARAPRHAIRERHHRQRHRRDGCAFQPRRRVRRFRQRRRHRRAGDEHERAAVAPPQRLLGRGIIGSSSSSKAPLQTGSAIGALVTVT